MALDFCQEYLQEKYEQLQLQDTRVAKIVAQVPGVGRVGVVGTRCDAGGGGPRHSRGQDRRPGRRGLEGQGRVTIGCDASGLARSPMG